MVTHLVRPLLENDRRGLLRVLLHGLQGRRLSQQGRSLGLPLLLLRSLLLLDGLDDPLPGGSILERELGQDLAHVVNLVAEWQRLW